MQEEYKVELKSDEYNEVIGSIPPVVVRYGIGILFVVLLFIIVLSAEIYYKTYIDCPVQIEQVDLSNQKKVYRLSFRLKPEDITSVQNGQNAVISLLQYPSHHFGHLNIVIRLADVEYIASGGTSYYTWSQDELNLTSDKKQPLKYLKGLQGSAKIVIGEESIIHKVTQSVRSTIGINF